MSLLIHFLFKQTLGNCLVPDSENWQYNEFFFYLNIYASQPIEFNLTKNIYCKVAMWMNSFFVCLLKMGAPKKNQIPTGIILLYPTTVRNHVGEGGEL